MNQETLTPQDEQDLQMLDDDAQDHHREQPQHIEVAESTMIGDLMALVIQELKVCPGSWQEMSEQQQDEVINRAESMVRRAVRNAIGIIAAAGTITVKGAVESVTFKDGAKAVLKGFGSGFHAVADMVGGTVFIVIPQNDDLADQGHDHSPDPDQAELPIAVEIDSEEKQEAA